MSRIIYYVIILPLSYLPLRMLYVVSDALSFILGRILKYRHAVIAENLHLTFPAQSQKFRSNLTSKFYSHLSDLVVEAVKAFSISNRQIRKRYHVNGAEVTFDDFHCSKNIIVVSAHYGNWEWASLACPLYFKHQCAVIITPLSDPFLNKKLSQSRGRNGYDLVPKSEVKDYLKAKGEKPRAVFFLSDQSPSNPDRAYWTEFLGVRTPVQFGVEKYSREYDMPIYYIDVQRKQRGKYEVNVLPLIEDPSTLPEGQIIQKVTQCIEEKILRDPSQWLWSHRRWKHKEKRVGK